MFNKYLIKIIDIIKYCKWMSKFNLSFISENILINFPTILASFWLNLKTESWWLAALLSWRPFVCVFYELPRQAEGERETKGVCVGATGMVGTVRWAREVGARRGDTMLVNTTQIVGLTVSVSFVCLLFSFSMLLLFRLTFLCAVCRCLL